MEIKKIGIQKSEFEMITVNAFRYAIGRYTYVVTETIEFLNKYWEHLSDHVKDLILREMKFEVFDKQNVLCKFCNEEWRKFYGEKILGI